jgi:hypothetical protein
MFRRKAAAVRTDWTGNGCYDSYLYWYVKERTMGGGKVKRRNQVYVTVRLKGKSLELATTTENVIDDVLYPAGGNRIGVVLINSKKHLGVEKRAVPVLEELFAKSQFEPGDLGDIQWWKAGGGFCFGWLGPNKVRWPINTFIQACHTKDDAFRPGEFQVIPDA